MKIQVKMIGHFIYEAGFSEKEVEAHETITLAELLSLLKLNRGRPRVVTRNGRAIAPTEKLQDGDRIVISPLYSGG